MIPYEEKKRLQKKIRNMRYRAKHGGMVGVGAGRRPKKVGEILTDISSGGNIRQTILEATPEPIQKTRLSTKSSLEEFDNEILRLNDELIQSGQPAALKAGVDTLLKMSEGKRKNQPLEEVERKPRPRTIIVIDEED